MININFLATLCFSHTVPVTTQLLLQLFSHNMDLKIWDTKDKVSPRARFDRPKAFRLPASRDPEDLEAASGGVMQIVTNQQQSYESNQPKQSRIFHSGEALSVKSLHLGLNISIRLNVTFINLFVEFFHLHRLFEASFYKINLLSFLILTVSGQK